jgi:hypothetical protein
MGVGLETIGRAVHITLTRRRTALRRVVVLALALSLYATLWLLVRLAQLLDEVLFPRYRRQKVRAPVFIIAPPRSGTTYLHRLMSLDEAQFTCYRTYQTLLPAVTLYRLVELLKGLDPQLGRVLSEVRRWIDRTAFSRWRNIHPMGLTQSEEDEALFLYTLHTPGFYLLFPFVDEFPQLHFLDRLPVGDRWRVMGFYRRCVQRHLYAAGGGQTFLSKNVLSTGRIGSLLEAFPDARFVFIVRSPYEAVPSFLSMFYAVWESHSPDIPKASPETEALARLILAYYRHLQQMREHTMPVDQCLCLDYRDLVARPVETIERVYDHFGLHMTKTFRLCLEGAARRAQEERPTHHYSLEEYGLSEAFVHRELGDVMQVLGEVNEGKDSPEEVDPTKGRRGWQVRPRRRMGRLDNESAQ